MILYLSRNENANLLDLAANEKSLHIRKISGSLSLSEFVVKDMRKYASCKYFCVERLAMTENDNEFLKAIESFQMISSARVIVIYESINGTDNFISGLKSHGVADIVTATDMNDKLEQIAECLCDIDTKRNNLVPMPIMNADDEPYVEKRTLVQSKRHGDTEEEHYRFDCLNVKIGVIGATRRVGTTTVAIGLANFIRSHGGTACYVALNTNRHLESIADEYDFDTEEDYYTFNGVDYYEGMLSKHDYNFVIMDFGDVKREAVRKFKECDIHLLCGASRTRYEIVEFAEGLKSVKSVKPLIFTYSPNSEHDQLFSSTVTDAPIIIEATADMLDYQVNGLIFKEMVKEHIVETLKRL